MDLKAIVIAAVIGAAGGFAGSYCVFEKQINRIDDMLVQRPPIVVADFASIAMNYPVNASEVEIQQLMVKTNNAFMRLSEAGYLVIDRSNVIMTPDEIVLPPEAILK